MTFPLGIQGFRGSDWDNSGKNLYAVKYDTTKQYDVILRSTDGGPFEECNITVSDKGGHTSDFFPVSYRTPYYWYAIPLIIPTKVSDGDADQMLISPIGSQTLFLCSDITQDPMVFEAVLTDESDCTGSGGIFNGFAEKEIDNSNFDGTLYAGWYSIFSNYFKAWLYKGTPDYKNGSWQPIATDWRARHIHTVRVNPHNGYLYVILGEPNYIDSTPVDSPDAAKIMRLDLTNPNSDWVCVTDTWSITVVPSDPNGNRLGLYFSTLGFIPHSNRVVLGEDTDFGPGRIWYFDDDGRDGTDHKKPLPFNLQPSYDRPSYTADNDGEFFLGAVSMGEKLYFASQFLAPTQGVTSTQCISTTDGETWTVEEVCSSPDYSSNPGENSCLGIFTYHPKRGGGLIYSLSANNSYYIEGSKQS